MMSSVAVKPLHRCKGGAHVETRIAAAACAGGVARPCYRFTRPGEMPTPPTMDSAETRIAALLHRRLVESEKA
jgi:hypothetical protein